jgi:hypothetical protein
MDEAYADRNTDPSKVQSETSALVEELRDRVRFLARTSLSSLASATGRTGASSPVRYRRGSGGRTEAPGGAGSSVAELRLIGLLGSSL